jgi:hypothetical protein
MAVLNRIFRFLLLKNGRLMGTKGVFLMRIGTDAPQTEQIGLYLNR